MGISQRTVGNYKRELQLQQIKQQNNKSRIIKRLTSLEYRFTNFESGLYSREEMAEFKAAAIPAINAMMKQLDIDPCEL